MKCLISISDSYDNELRKIDDKLNENNKNESEIKELKSLYDNLKIEKENELNKCEDRFSSQIESMALDFKQNYNNNDKGLLLLNEKFALTITKKLFDMIK